MQKIATFLKIITICTISLLLGTIDAHGIRTSERAQIADSLTMALQKSNNGKDSLLILYNLFDLSQGKQRGKRVEAVCRKAYEIGDNEACLDALRHLANINSNNDSVLCTIENSLHEFEQHPQHLETRLFVRMLRIAQQIKEDSESDIDATINDLLAKATLSKPKEHIDQVELLFAITVYLGERTKGTLFEKYFNKLDQMLDSLPVNTGTVRNLVYTRSSIPFMKTHNFKRVLELNKKTLNVIDSLRLDYNARGRIYRDFSHNRYNSYRQMLTCYPELSQAEINLFYKKIQELAAQDDWVNYDMSHTKRPQIFYYLATDQLEKAIPLIKEQLEKKGQENVRSLYLEVISNAPEGLVDSKTQLAAAKELNTILQEKIDSKFNERYRELRIIYDLNEAKERHARDVIGSQSDRIHRYHILAIIALVVLIILCILFVNLYKKNRRIKNLMTESAKANEELITERDKLKKIQADLIQARDKANSADKLKSDFINNMSHEVKTPLSVIAENSRVIVDCIPENQRPYLERFAETIDVNTKLVLTLVNDVLDISSLENNHMTVETFPTSAIRICRLAIENVFGNISDKKTNPEIVCRFNQYADVQLRTDERRVMQILMNLLANARKFTDRGSITLDFKLQGDDIQFIVSDTGIGIPDNCKEKIFERFIKLDPTTQGSGLGLYISRKLAELIGGTLGLDTDYLGGSRFVLTIKV